MRIKVVSQSLHCIWFIPRDIIMYIINVRWRDIFWGREHWNFLECVELWTSTDGADEQNHIANQTQKALKDGRKHSLGFTTYLSISFSFFSVEIYTSIDHIICIFSEIKPQSTLVKFCKTNYNKRSDVFCFFFIKYGILKTKRIPLII